MNIIETCIGGFNFHEVHWYCQGKKLSSISCVDLIVSLVSILIQKVTNAILIIDEIFRCLING